MEMFLFQLGSCPIVERFHNYSDFHCAVQSMFMTLPTLYITACSLSFCYASMQMAGIAAADELNDRQRFRSFFRTDVASEFVGPALAEMARQFNWTQMAIVSQDESLFIKVCVNSEV